ncbi:CBS domain-containing protein [bacterium]|nr:CBS domain-containing protein [bacterium]
MGKLGHITFLRALEPKYQKIGDLERLSREGWSSDFLRSMLDTVELWKQRFHDYALYAKRTMVKDVMRPVGTGLDIDAPLSEAVHQLVIQETLSLLVTEKGKVVGILRLTDVFNEIAGKMMLWATEQNNADDIE